MGMAGLLNLVNYDLFLCPSSLYQRFVGYWFLVPARLDVVIVGVVVLRLGYAVQLLAHVMGYVTWI